jgi:hypothetical protein
MDAKKTFTNIDIICYFFLPLFGFFGRHKLRIQLQEWNQNTTNKGKAITLFRAKTRF